MALPRRSSQTVLDLLALSAAHWVGFMLRFDWDIPFHMAKRAAFTWPYVVGFEYLVLALMGVPLYAWRYVSLREVTRIASATGVATAGLLAVRFAAELGLAVSGYAKYALVPVGVIAVNFMLSFLGISGTRILWRLHMERKEKNRRHGGATGRDAVPTLLIGAGQAGVMVARELHVRPDLGIKAVGFLDDAAEKIGTVVQGVPVLGAIGEIREIAARRQAKQVLVTIASAPRRDIRRIVMSCEDAGLPTKIIPGLYEIVGGEVNLSRIRPVAIEDLLGREPVHLDLSAISTLLQGKVVLISGAGGSIGSEIARQVARFGPAVLVLVERSENALFEITQSIQSWSDGVDVRPALADVGDEPRMRRLLSEERPNAVFHAAAHKHVPLMETNPGEAIKNNIVGTRVLADLARELGVQNFVFISSDKAVNPSSVMGATKRVAELYLQGLAERSTGTVFVAVRFGNVLGSHGSVVPIFKEQIARGGPVTVTHPEMRRYFMTIPEASQLVLEAATIGRGGEVLVLDMGEPVRIVDLARDLIRLSGLEPGRDIEIEYTGIRRGEKLFEELSTDDEAAERTRHEKIFIGRVAGADWDALNRGIADLARNADGRDDVLLYSGLRALIPGFSGEETSAGKVVPLSIR